MSLPTAEDAYFQGLLSERLGAGRLVDDELVMLILQDREFGKLCGEYSATSVSPNGAADRVAAKAVLLSVPAAPPHDWAVWSAVLDDPRFDLVWKRALDDLRDPLPIVRNSILGRLLSLLGKLKKPAATASALPLLLGFAAAISAVWAVPSAWRYTNERPSQTSPPTTLNVELKETDKQLIELNANLATLSTILSKCVQCKAGASPSTPAAQQTIDWTPLTTVLRSQGNSLRASVEAVRSEVQQDSSSIINLGKATTNDTASFNQIHADLSADSSALVKKLNLIEQHTQQTLTLLNDDFTGPRTYLNSTLNSSKESVADIQKKQSETLALQDALRAPRFTVDSLGKGASFLLELRNTPQCMAFQVLQMNRDSVILRYKVIDPCTNVRSAVGLFAANDLLTTRLDATPRLVSTISGAGANALYLALDQTREISLVFPTRKRSFIGAYTSAVGWTIK